MLDKHISHHEGYLRAEFTGGNFDTANVEINRHLLGVYHDALIYHQTRIMLVVNAQRHNEYPLVDLACLSSFINAIFQGMRLAYVNLYPILNNDTRRKFFMEHRRLSNGMSFEMFGNEAEALIWLLSDDE